MTKITILKKHCIEFMKICYQKLIILSVNIMFVCNYLKI